MLADNQGDARRTCFHPTAGTNSRFKAFAYATKFTNSECGKSLFFAKISSAHPRNIAQFPFASV